jgi:hypothetical protein
MIIRSRWTLGKARMGHEQQAHHEKQYECFFHYSLLLSVFLFHATV